MRWRLTDYRCVACGRTWESLEDRDAELTECACDCGGRAHRRLAAPKIRPCYASVTRGPVSRPPPGALDTRDLGDRMPRSEWRKRQEKIRRERAWRRAKEAVS